MHHASDRHAFVISDNPFFRRGFSENYKYIALSNLINIFFSSILTSYNAFTGVDAIMTMMKMMRINGFLLLI